MPKLKTHKGAAKRFKKTGTGKFSRRRSFARHLLTAKSPARKRRLATGTILSSANINALRVMLPY
jgi:large subunit ribosomal protein L35